MASLGGFDNLVQVNSSSTSRLAADGEGGGIVKEFRRGRFGGSAKIDPCPQAELTLEVTDSEGTTINMALNIPLDDVLLWKIVQLFQACGLIAANIPDGTSIRFPWDQLQGSHFRCIIGHHTWKDRNGGEHVSNDITRFLPYQPTYQQADGPIPLDSLVPPETFQN